MASHFHEELSGWLTVQNPHRFVDELIEIEDFAKIIENR
jgi:hypothetical protein